MAALAQSVPQMLHHLRFPNESEQYRRARNSLLDEEISLRRALSLLMHVYIGSNSSSGSPGKYIWVIIRVRNAGPKSEKWICAGRHAL